jgi:hypothetical protein
VPVVARKLQTLVDVGLSYITLGQSGDHALRRRGAARQAGARTVEARHRPNALHSRRTDHRPALPGYRLLLLSVLHRLVDHGNTVVVIEHNLDVIKTADWLIDLGPEGGGRRRSHRHPADDRPEVRCRCRIQGTRRQPRRVRVPAACPASSAPSREPCTEDTRSPAGSPRPIPSIPEYSLRIRTAITTAALVLFPLAVAAQQPAAAAATAQPAVVEGMAAVGPGKFAGIVEAKVTLAVEAVDKVGRTLVLKDDKGEQSKFVVGDQAKNFDQIKVGDLVVVSYVQELMMTLKKGGGELRERVDSSQQGSAAPGQKPGAYVTKDVAFIADVQQVDRKKGTITLRGALRTVTLKVKDPQQLKLISKGDQVEGVYSEAMAIAVVPAGAKARK